MEKALENLDRIFSSEKISWHVERKFWLKCFKRVKQMSNASRIFRRIINAQRDDIGDYLSEVWFAVFFSVLGFQVVIEPSGKAGPDMEVTENGHSAIVEVTQFRRVYEGPPEICTNDERPVFVEYGDSRRDIEKAYNKIVGKFPQISKVNTRTSIIALWNSDGDLEEIEMEEAIRHLRRDSEEHRISIPSNLAFVLFGPWDDQLLCFPLRSNLVPYERGWMQKIEEMAVGQFIRCVLNAE
jgi:hypothetical protein